MGCEHSLWKSHLRGKAHRIAFVFKVVFDVLSEAEADYSEDEVDPKHDQLDEPHGDEVALAPLLLVGCHYEYVCVRERASAIDLLRVVSNARWSMIKGANMSYLDDE